MKEFTSTTNPENTANIRKQLNSEQMYSIPNTTKEVESETNNDFETSSLTYKFHIHHNGIVPLKSVQSK